MEPRFHLRCLGLPQLSGPDGQPIRFKVRKHLALLVYLAVESRARHRRDHLAELLWPNLPEADGRHSLATGLSMLRSCFGRDVVDASRDDLRWAYTRLDLDLDRLAAGQVIGDEMTPMLDVADFLDGFEVPGATEFMLWRERQRARWLPQVRDALIVLMDRARRTGDSRQIEQLADRMLALDDLSEEAIRAKMEARAFAGDRLGALKIFESWRDRLGEELNAVPSSLLEGMALRLRKRGWERSAASPIPSVRTDQWKGRTFVGRSAEYRALYEGWERTQAGLPGHALVIGESGIGKSTLVERLTTAAGLEGASVSRVQCYELEREIPYATLGGLVRGLLERPGASAVAPEALSDLARFVPEVRKRFPQVSPGQEGEGESARIRLAEAMYQLIQAVADEHPLILVVDDHHLADDASLAVLHHVMRRSESQPLMVVLVGRTGEVSASPHVTRFRTSLLGLGTGTIELPALTDAESDEIVAALIPPDQPQPNSAVRRALTQAAHGFPMVLELLCHDWQTHGERSLALALHAMTAEPGQSSTPTEAYRQLHQRILESLDSVTRNVLNLAAILGHQLNDIALYALGDLTVGQVMSGMSQLTSLRVLRDNGDGLEFINELMRAQAYLSVPSSIRRVLHSDIADRLIEREGLGITSEGLEVAWHCIRGGREAEAVPYLLRGARQAIERGAPHQAERALRTGLTILTGATLADGVLLLAEALQEQGQWIESLAALDACPSELSAEQSNYSFVLRHVAKRFLGDHEVDDTGRVVHDLIRIVASTNERRTRGRALYLGALLASGSRDLSLITPLLEKAESVHVGGDNSADTDVLVARAMLYAVSGQLERSRDTLTPVATATSRGGGFLGCALINGLGAVKCALGEYESAYNDFVAANKVASNLDNDSLACATAANVALCAARLGRYAEQLEWSDKAVCAMSPSHAGFREILAVFYRAHSLAMQGQHDAAILTIRTHEHRVPNTIPAWQKQAWLLYKADINQLAQRPREARILARRAVRQDFTDLQAGSLAGPFARWLALTSTPEAYKPTKLALRKLIVQLYRFDTLDQVEIICAMHFVTENHRSRARGLAPLAPLPSLEISRRLAKLPLAISAQLRQLGVIRH